MEVFPQQQMQRHWGKSLINVIHMIEPNQVPLTVNKIDDPILVGQKLMYRPYFKGELFGVELHVKNIKKLLIDDINERRRGMNVVNDGWENSLWDGLLVVGQVDNF